MGLRRVWLKVNGADRAIVCDGEKDTLADVLRRIGLTSVKVGCGVGQCGSCTVLFKGKAARACTVRMRRVEDYDEIETVEGIGTARALHPPDSLRRAVADLVADTYDGCKYKPGRYASLAKGLF